MKYKWFYQMLFSYFPVFFIMIFLLLFIVYLDVNNGSKKQLHATNEALARQSMHTLDTTLSAIEDLMIKEIINDKSLHLFYNANKKQFTAYELYMLTEKLAEIKRAYPLIDSIYFYNEPRQEILAMSGLLPVDQFFDGSFVKTMYPIGNTKWSNPRMYGPTPDGTAEALVVSLVKAAPVTSYKEGLAVVNIRVDKINAMLREISRSEYSFLDLRDTDGRSFLDYDKNKLPQESTEDRSGLLPALVKSSYSKWYMNVGLKDSQLIGSFFIITKLWMVVGGAIIIIGLVSLSYVSYRNYKPISEIVAGIHKFSKGRKGKYNYGAVRDELTLIQSVLTNLMEESSEMDKQQREDMKIKRKHEMIELLEGMKSYDSEAVWEAKLSELGLPIELANPTIIVADIDRYIEFLTQYNGNDQFLYKYMVRKTLEEVCQSHGILCWIEWIENNRLVALIHNEDSNNNNDAYVFELCEAVRLWVQQHLHITISIGMGPQAGAMDGIPYSYQEAVQALQYKATFGTNRTISYLEIDPKPSNGIYDYLSRVRELAEFIRLGNPSWKEGLSGVFAEIAKERFTRDEITNLLSYFIYYLQKEMMELGELFQNYWKETAMPKLIMLTDRTETLQEASEQLIAILNQTETNMNSLRENRSSHETMTRIKLHIEDHFDSPTISLDKLSEDFGMSPRYISRLFKEEYGETFIGYVSGLRIKKAKQLLESSNASIQAIVERIGYLSASSFIRIFRKAVGMTPGEYRNTHKDKNNLAAPTE